ncbi:MAG: ABC transporter permease [Ktedonobacteraceae bacterium]
MLKNIQSDLRLYQYLLIAQMRAQVQYRINMVIDISTYFAVTSLEFVAMLVYFGPFPSMFGWKVGEVAMLYAVMSTSFGFAEMFGAGIDLFPDTIRLGEFDRILLRPASSFMLVVASDFRLRRLGRISQGCIAFIIALHLLPDLHWTFAKFVALLFGIGSGAVLFMAVLLLGATLCFWTVETTELTNILTYGGREMLSYPLVIYNQVLQRFFLFVVPLAFGSYVPTCYLLGRSLPFGLPNEVSFGAPLVALLFSLVAAATWRFGVHHYQSTGS